MKYFFNLNAHDKSYLAGDYSSAFGAVVEGERMQIALVHKEKGTGSRLHSHPNEQFNYILKGTFKAKVEGEEKTLVPGELMHIPANAHHYLIAVSDGGGDYFVAKDMSWGIAGNAVDGKKTGAHYDLGFESD
ncbi:MAG: cupin domain-containing protein [Desulfobacterales bacterium]|nr:cupin domain-containing protein [Desulfobacterales bacterium]